MVVALRWVICLCSLDGCCFWCRFSLGSVGFVCDDVLVFAIWWCLRFDGVAVNLVVLVD